MKRRIVANALTACIGIALALVLLEALVRVAGSKDVDGQFTFIGLVLEPRVLPVIQLRARIEEHLAHQEHSTIVYDQALGWAFRPRSARQSGTFTINGAGFRSTRDFDLAPPPETVRIATFGDSFTAGDDVNDEEVWTSQLERVLQAAGMRAEVLNFGTGGYGMDQAYLTWKHRGQQYQPDIVIFGFQPENLKRNVNVFRQLLDPSRYTLPFSKPRFVLDSGQLALVNFPPLPPEQLPTVFENFGQHPLAQHEFHYRSRNTASRWWTPSRLAGLINAVLNRDDTSPGYYAADTEGGQLGRAIVDAFAASSTQHDASFVVLHLPLQSHLRRYYSNLPPPDPPYKHLLDHFRAAYLFVDMQEQLDRAFLDDAYWTKTKHYGPEIHASVAQAVAHELVACVATNACPLPRLGEAVDANSDARPP